MDKHTGRELHMLKTLRRIFAMTQHDTTAHSDLLDALHDISGIAFPFTVAGPSDSELDRLIAEDRKAHDSK